MTSDARRRANRENAAKSTGPRTEEGKRRASGNACRHGLSRPPARSGVMAWYRVITGAELDPGRPAMSEEDHAALALAQAEAQLSEAVHAEERFLEDLESGEDLAPHLRHAREIVKEIWRGIPGVSPEVERILLARRGAVPHKITRKIRETWTAPHVHLGRLARYRKAAEVRRHKALEAWIRILREEKTPKRSQGLPIVAGPLDEDQTRWPGVKPDSHRSHSMP